jgi:hypothetical protein
VEIAAVKYCLQTFGSPLSTESPPKGADVAYWSNVRMYKDYENKETLQNQMVALHSNKAELLKIKNLLLQQRQQGTAAVAQSGSAVLSTEKQGEHRGS